jgi:hypothetical protein
MLDDNKRPGPTPAGRENGQGKLKSRKAPVSGELDAGRDSSAGQVEPSGLDVYKDSVTTRLGVILRVSSLLEATSMKRNRLLAVAMFAASIRALIE